MSIKKKIKTFINKYPLISVVLRKYKDNKYLRQKPIKTKYGFLFGGNPLMVNNEFEMEETLFLRKIIPYFDCTVNIGANIGYYCCQSISLNVPVIAFEPSTGNYNALLRNIYINNYDAKIEAHMLALSDKTGIGIFYGGGTGASLVQGWNGVPKTYSTLVSLNTLDNVIGERLKGKKIFYLVDVEGAEYDVIKGSKKSLTADSVWFVEISINEHMPDGVKINPNILNVFECFWNRNFRSYTGDGTWRRVDYDEIYNVIETGDVTINTHNFIFVGSSVDIEKLKIK